MPNLLNPTPISELEQTPCFHRQDLGFWCPSLSRALRQESGATMVEIAVTLPIFSLLLFGLINFALVIFGFCNVTYASRFAARYASLHSSTSQVPATTTSVQSIVAPFIFQYPANTSSTTLFYVQQYAASNGNLIGNAAGVTVSITYTLVMPFFTFQGPALSSTSYGLIIQ